ncbi:hypothetical protein ACFSLT_01475 [Novosphingobium resinovorum]
MPTANGATTTCARSRPATSSPCATWPSASWQERFADRLHARRLHRIDAGHQVMNTRPEALAEVLLAEARS